MPDLDRINRSAYRQRGVLRQYGSASGWLEPGEQAAIRSVAESARGAPILDIGIGGGRTAPLMRAISLDYCGIDYTAAMVAMARQRFPDMAFREMDARHLEFPDGSFALVAFSYNGIDSVDLAGRREILREVHRVLRPGGYFVFSSLNRDGIEAMPHWPDWRVFHGTGLWPARLLRATAKLLAGGVNHLRHQGAARDNGVVAFGNLSAHNFALVSVFTSMTAELYELHETGFILEAIFDPDGRQIPADGQTDIGAAWHHFVARRRGDRIAIARRELPPSLPPGWALRHRFPGWRRSRRDPA
jgi:SAM-dependent methyltransferase